MRWINGITLTQSLLGLFFGLSAALLSLTPNMGLLEEKLGLSLLFALRGEQAPPAEVLMVSIDHESARRLHVSGNAEQWPHRLHAEAIRRLHAAGAELIGFNIFFSTPQPEDDAAMAAAMRAAGNVVLANYLTLQPLQGGAYVEALEPLPPVLAEAALAASPFLLAKNEETEKFLLRYGENNEQATLPLTLLRLYGLKTLAHELFVLLQDQVSAPSAWPLAQQAQFFSELDSRFAAAPTRHLGLLRKLHTLPARPAQQATLRSLIVSLTRDHARYFNHYGPAGTIPRIAYHQLLTAEAPPLDLRGKIVLIGFSEHYPSAQAEERLYSAYSTIGALELAATAVANLLDDSDIHALFGPSGQFIGLLVWGLLLGRLAVLPLGRGGSAIIALTALYAVAAYWLFARQSLWLPLLVPILWLLPLTLLGCLLHSYLSRSRENRKIHSIIRRFIPEQAAPGHSHGETKVSFGVCLATDAGQYTALAESMLPLALGELMNDYYSTLFPVVRRHGGWVSDVTGDAMMAVWSVQQANQDIRVGALNAALDILHAVDVFQAKHRVQLPIRMGLHCGEMRVGFIGGKEHGAYRAVGDTVNTSARLEGLNKSLGTRILLSASLIDGLSGFISRPVGSFMLAGKSRPILVHELLASANTATLEMLDLRERFAHALTLFQAADWHAAAEAFAEVAEFFPDDGPSHYYCQQALANANNPQATPDFATIRISKPPPGVPAKHKH